MQHGISVIIAKQTGLTEVVSGGVKVAFWDVRRIADAMINVLHHALLRAELVNAGQRDLRTLTWVRAATLVTKVYQEVL